MRYTNFTELPIHAFQPKLGKGPFSYGMTLEGGGGGGGGIVGGIVNAVSSVFEGAGKAVESVGKSISQVGVEIDKGVNNAVPGGWATVGAVALMVAAPYAAPYLAAEAGAVSAAEAAAALEAAAAAEGATTAGMVTGASSASTVPTLTSVAEAAAANAAKSAAINSTAQLVTKGSIDPSQVINAGITGGVTGGLNNTLSAYTNPAVGGALSGAVGGTLNAAINNRDIGMGALTGGIGGGVGGATSMVGRELGLNPYAQGALSGATSGMTGAALNAKSVGVGGLTGAAVGTAGAAGRELGTALQNEVTGDADRRTITGDILSAAAREEARDLLTPDVPRRPMPTPMPRTMLAGAPASVSYLQPGALPQQRSMNPQTPMAFTPRMSPAGAPIFGNEQSSSSLLSQTGMPSMASTTEKISDVSLAGGAAGVPTGSSPNANVGSVTGLFPSSGLNAAGLPAPLASGVLTSQMLSDQAADTPQMAQLKQLYPQLENVDPRILASLTNRAPVQQLAKGGPVRMNEGGDTNRLDINRLLEKIEKANRNARFAENDRLFKHAAESLGPAQNKYAARVPFGDPSGNYNRPIASQYFVNRAKGGAIHSLSYGSHNPEFITGKTGHYVKGRGDGQSDDIPAMLADGEYVFDADTVAALGNGSSDAGARILDKMRQEIRKHKRSASVDKIPPKAKSPLEYLKKAKA